MRELLQAAAICLHGNHCPSEDSQERPTELLGRCSAFDNAYELEFLRSNLSTGGESVTAAFGTSRWYKRLRREGVKEYSLIASLPYGASQPPGQWGILTEGSAGFELWKHQKRMRVRYERDATPYKVELVSSRFDRSQLITKPDVGAAEDDLKDALEGMAAQLRRTTHDVEAYYFTKLCDQFEERTMPKTAFVDIVPAGLKGSARLTLAYAIAALPAIDDLSSDLLEESNIKLVAQKLWEASAKVLLYEANASPNSSVIRAA